MAVQGRCPHVRSDIPALAARNPATPPQGGRGLECSSQAFAAAYWSRSDCGTRPRSETWSPCERAHSRIAEGLLPEDRPDEVGERRPEDRLPPVLRAALMYGSSAFFSFLAFDSLREVVPGFVELEVAVPRPRPACW